eukprot:Nk52_evm29s2209 gene=Nk52_evmTU29s2209
MYSQPIGQENSPSSTSPMGGMDAIVGTTFGRLRAGQLVCGAISFLAGISVYLDDGCGYWGLRFHWFVSLICVCISGGLLWCGYSGIQIEYGQYDRTFIELLSSALATAILFVSSSIAAGKGMCLAQGGGSALTISVVFGFLGVVLWATMAYFSFKRWKSGFRRFSPLTEDLVASATPFEPYEPPSGDL